MRMYILGLWVVLALTSCKVNEGAFSCDAELNAYVKRHRNDLKSASIGDLSKSDLAYQQAVFRSWDAEQKRQAWMEKIEVLLETQNYSSGEYNHVNSLLGHLHEGYFEKEGLEAEATERRQFAGAWISKAKNDFGWSDKQVAFVVYRLYTDPSQRDAELAAVSHPDGIDPVGNCACSTKSDFCSNAVCQAGSCVLQSTGCGWLWSEACDGLCR